MKIIRTVEDLRHAVQQWRRQGNCMALVPTMGNLHAGHISLVEQAHQHAEKVVVSIFVNPMQFGPNEDFDCYPRTPDEDCAQLEAAGADIVFLPDVSAIYPSKTGHTGLQATTVHVDGVTEGLCGGSRPGHFDGVTTVVNKLFNLVQPDVALFGQKDFQQLAAIRQMVADLCMPIEIVGVPICREEDGLAMSSRNRYLDKTQRQLATKLYASLQCISAGVQQGKRFEAIIPAQVDALHQSGFEVDYLELRNAQNLALARSQDQQLVVLIAARLGQTRLIDNLCFSRAG